MANGHGVTVAADTPVYRVPINPPPPTPVARVVAVVLSLIAAILGLLGFGFYAGLTAGGGFVFGLADILRNRGFISVPRSALDDQGRLKGFKAGDVG